MSNLDRISDMAIYLEQCYLVCHFCEYKPKECAVCPVSKMTSKIKSKISAVDKQLDRLEEEINNLTGPKNQELSKKINPEFILGKSSMYKIEKHPINFINPPKPIKNIY